MPLVFNDPAYWLERAITALQVADKPSPTASCRSRAPTSLTGGARWRR
jgi:hypothetical protein